MLKKILVSGLAVTAITGLIACAPKSSGRHFEDNYEQHTGVDPNDFSRRVDLGVSVRTGNNTSISNRANGPISLNLTGSDAFSIAVGGILPSWAAIGHEDMLNINFRDASGDQGNWNNPGLLSEFNAGRLGEPDLFTNGQEALNQLGSSGRLVALNEYFGYMPNFTKFLEQNPSVAAQLRHAANNGIFWTPYFDGFEAPDQMFSMNVDFVAALLDANPTQSITNDWFAGQIATRRGGANTWGDTQMGVNNQLRQVNAQGAPVTGATGLQDVRNDTVNGRTGTLTDELTVVRVADGNDVPYTFTRTIEQGRDIFSRTAQLFEENQNNPTGSQMIEMFISYIDEVYGDWLPGGSKTTLWQHRSEIFTGVSAVHNADEFITLLRVVRMNPHFLTGHTDINKAVINPFVPRSGNGNRQDAVLSLASIWGVRGVRSRGGDRWFIDKDGFLQDGRHQESLLDAIDDIRLLYLEGLIPYEFYKGHGGAEENSNDAIQHQFIANRAPNGQIFAIYDFNASQTIFNRAHQISEGTEGAENWVTTGLMPVLPPVARWETGLTEGTPLFSHFTEDMRAMRDEGWGLVVNPNRSQEDTIRAIQLIDRMFDHVVADEDVSSLQGGDRVSDIINFGPKDGTIVGNNTFRGFRAIHNIGGVDVIGFSDEFLRQIMGAFRAPGQNGNQGWATEMRRISGISLTTGHVRPNTTDFLTTSREGQKGIINLNRAINAGVVRVVKGAPLGSLDSDFFVQVPVSFPLSESQQQAVSQNQNHQRMVDFFSREGSAPLQFSRIIVHGWDNDLSNIPTRAQLLEMINSSRTSVLPIMRFSFRFVNDRM